MKRIFKLLLLISLSINCTANESFYLLPKDAEQALNAIIKNIDLSKKSIKITIYNFTHKKIAKRLKAAAKRGVKIEIIFDNRSASKDKKRSMLYYLAKYKNITVYKLKGKLSKNKKYSGIMHLKTALFDHNRILFGSANWSYSAFSKNYELIYITKDIKIAKKFEKYFNFMKGKSKVFK